jgi:hypothetical protein
MGRYLLVTLLVWLVGVVQGVSQTDTTVTVQPNKGRTGAVKRDSLVLAPVPIADSVIVGGGSAYVQKEKSARRRLFARDSVPSPRKAVILSVIVPGGGQIYNRKYWKLPIVYGGFGAFGYLIVANGVRFRTYKKAYLYREDGNPSTVDPFEEYSSDDLRTLRNAYQKNMELSAVGLLLVYTLGSIDAFVDAHLATFDVSDDLSVRPVLVPALGMGGAVPSLSAVYKF